MIINYDCAIGKRVIPYVDLVLRKKINSSAHGKKIYIKSMAIEIFYLYIKAYNKISSSRRNIKQIFSLS